MPRAAKCIIRKTNLPDQLLGKQSCASSRFCDTQSSEHCKAVGKHFGSPGKTGETEVKVQLQPGGQLRAVETGTSSSQHPCVILYVSWEILDRISLMHILHTSSLSVTSHSTKSGLQQLSAVPMSLSFLCHLVSHSFVSLLTPYPEKLSVLPVLINGH